MKSVRIDLDDLGDEKGEGKGYEVGGNALEYLDVSDYYVEGHGRLMENINKIIRVCRLIFISFIDHIEPPEHGLPILYCFVLFDQICLDHNLND